MAENNKNHAPVAASLNLDDEAKSLYQSWQHSQPNRCSIPPWEKASESARAEWIEAANSRRTPPAEVSADTLPPPMVSTRHGTPCYTVGQMLDHTRNVVAPYAEQIKKLERELSEHKAARIAYASEFAPNADGEPDVGNIHANIRNLKRELAERKPASIDTPEFRELLIEYWNCTLGGEEERTLIAYIDARPAGTAPAPCRNCADFGWEPSISGDRRPCGFCKSGSTGTEESK